jgi:hypothetical protein
MIEVRYEGERVLIPDGKEEELLNFLDAKYCWMKPEEKARRDARFDAMMARRKE